MTFGTKILEMSPSWNFDVRDFKNLFEPVFPNSGDGFRDDIIPIDRFQTIDRLFLGSFA